jgi:hypothetical protein
VRRVRGRHVDDGVGAVEGARDDRRVGEVADARGGRERRAVDADDVMSRGERREDRAADAAGTSGEDDAHGALARHFTSSSSTSKSRVAFGGITPPAPRAP